MAPRKVALVTGGSAGLGAAIARLLARDLQMSVVINYSQNVTRAEDLVRELQEAQQEKDGLDPPVFKAIQADLHSKPDVARLVEETVAATGGRLDVVVSNFGWTKMTNFADLEEGMDEEVWDRCFNANVKSHLWLFHAARRYLEEANEREEGAAVFVSTASTAGVKPAGSSLPYAVSKAALIHLVRCLANICAPSIRVNAVSPALLLTEWGLSFPEEKIAAAKEASKLKRFATVEDTAEQVRAFIVSKGTTAQNAVVDGGYCL